MEHLRDWEGRGREGSKRVGRDESGGGGKESRRFGVGVVQGSRGELCSSLPQLGSAQGRVVRALL